MNLISIPYRMKKIEFPDDLLKQILKKPMTGIDLKTGKPIRISWSFRDRMLYFTKRERRNED